MSKKAICPECKVEFLQRTADENEGLCLRCLPNKNQKADHGHVVDSITLGIRLLLAFFFGSMLAGFGYGIGAVVWSGLGVLLGLVFFPIGFVYGFFCHYINPYIRSFFSSLHD